MEQTLTLSPALLKDIPELAKLVHLAYRSQESKKGWTTEADLITGLRTDEAGLQAMIEKPAAQILKLSDGAAGAITGCVYLEKQGTDLYLGLITVSPALQDRGIGRLLLGAAEQEALRLGCRRITMGVISIRHELIAWYERHGYAKTGVVRPLPVDEKLVISKEPFVLMELAKAVGKKGG